MIRALPISKPCQTISPGHSVGDDVRRLAMGADVGLRRFRGGKLAAHHDEPAHFRAHQVGRLPPEFGEIGERADAANRHALVGLRRQRAAVDVERIGRLVVGADVVGEPVAHSPRVGAGALEIGGPLLVRADGDVRAGRSRC